MEFNLNILVVIMGGVLGFGVVIVCLLVSYGVKCVFFDLNEEKGEVVVNEIGGVFCNVNVMFDESVDVGFVKLCVVIGQEWILINCVGIGNVIKMVSCNKEIGEIFYFLMDKFDLIIQINLVGMFCCIVKFVVGMMILDLIDGECGVIVNIVFVVVEDGQIGQVLYFVFKGGVVGMILFIVCDLLCELICVNIILLGIFDMFLLVGVLEKVCQVLGVQVLNLVCFGNLNEYVLLVVEMCKNGYFNGEDVCFDGVIWMVLC